MSLRKRLGKRSEPGTAFVCPECDRAGFHAAGCASRYASVLDAECAVRARYEGRAPPAAITGLVDAFEGVTLGDGS